MALINRAIANLFNGISQQPASLRLPTQAEIQENGYSSVVEGLRKRPPSKHLAKITSSTDANAYVHTINRDTSERYSVVVTNGDLKVFDLAGVEKTVNFPNGKTYLTSTSAWSDFSLLTVQDYTFVVNKTITTLMDTTLSTGTIIGIVNRYTDLPHQVVDSANAVVWYWNSVPLASAPVDGDIWKVMGEQSNNFTAYYVKFGASSWTEWTCPNITTTFNATTLPWKLIRNGDGTFTFDKITWSNRLVGDDVTAPVPSFIGSKISDIFFYRDRLGFISNEHVIFSRVGKFFSFFPKTVTVVRDDDPIDASITSTKVAALKYAVSFNTSLLLFSEQSQFTLSARDTLTPKSVNINPTTEYALSGICKPVGAGQNIYFSINRGSFSSIKEYYVQPMTYTFDATDVTAHCPKYVPSGVFKIASTTVEDCLFALSRDERNALYVYKYYWGDASTKLQSSWSKWIFGADDVILNVDVIDTTAYLTIQRADGIYLESIDLQVSSSDSIGVLVHLDRRVTLTGTYSSTTGLTTWVLPYSDTSPDFQVVLGSGFGAASGTMQVPSRPSATTVTLAGNFTNSTVYVGKKYTLRYRFSKQFYKDKEKVAIAHGQLMMKNMQVFFTNTGYFRAEVTPLYRDTYTYIYSGKTVGSQEWTVGNVAIGGGIFTIPLMTDSDSLTLDLINDSYLPSYFQSAEWEADLSTRSTRGST
jgi:hypothetical protein